MATMEKKEDHQLNDLLDSALDDLLDAKELEDVPKGPDISETLKKITEVTKSAQTEGSKPHGSKKSSTTTGEGTSCGSSGGPGSLGVDEEEMNRFFENMTAQLKAELPKIDPDEARAKINESVPQIFDLMQNLLSKELLYPALKDLTSKFDDWLKKNAATLSKEDKKRYRKQKQIIDEILYNFDDEALDAQEKFEKNLDLMEKMQTLGPTPEELAVPMPDGLSKCSVM